MSSQYPPHVIARFPSVCALTRRPIQVGDRIRREGRGWAHVDAVAPAAPEPPARAPFTGPLGYHGHPETREEIQIDGEAERVFALYAVLQWHTPHAQRVEADRQCDLLSPAARARFNALCEMRNPYDR